MPIIGTAGHVDHGKSTLVQTLTGIDPDRWAEEKARGLTIDLGFAWATVGGHDVGFIDVPGHEKFIKNMLAGVGALDCALFVVAADSGWMPQSEEHAAVLDLLGVPTGVIALTRVDLTDADTVEMAMLEVMGEVEGTRLEKWPIVGVSAVTGFGIDELRSRLTEALDGSTADTSGPLRMWVDRSFSMTGAGQVVTGTVASGEIAVDDVVVVQPDGHTVRVRGIQHHGKPAPVVGTGMRAALNIVGSTAVERGALVASRGSVAVTERMLITLEPTRRFDAIPDRGAFHLHIGTASRPSSIRRLGNTDAYIVTVTEPVPSTMGDRVILRDTGRKAVVGGGIVLDPIPTARPSALDIERLLGAVADPMVRADALLDVHGTMRLDNIAAATGGAEPQGGMQAGPLRLSSDAVEELRNEAMLRSAAYHDVHPARPGIPKQELASTLGVDGSIIDAVVAGADGIVATSAHVRLASFTVNISDEDRRRCEQACEELEASFDVPRISALGLGEELVHHLIREGRIVRIGDDLAFTAAQVADIRDRVSELPDGFTVSEFRDHFGMARRQAVPVLEWLDSIGRTRRNGDRRSVRT
ncbi:MAG TPA: selenocysteine-specific translation elongation factor [Acidimicrobiia bacterium]|nr:selenocysteine-specific translation elongation factor [Acidimicrobiia bacterium]